MILKSEDGIVLSVYHQIPGLRRDPIQVGDCEMQETDYATLLDRLCTREEVVFDNAEGVSVDLEDISFLVRDVWRAKSARALEATEEKGLSRSAKNFHFTR